jgi:L-threonylcarbamoyladenylate synthase
MTHLYLKKKEIKPAIIQLIAGSLKIGQVVVLPTDTIYGLSCLATDGRAIKKIQKLKERDAQKPLLVLIDSIARLKKYTFVSRRQEAMLKKIWFGAARPTTVILRHRGRLPKELTGDSDGLAVRLPKSEFLVKILQVVKQPIVSSSLNLSNQKSIPDLKLLPHYFPKKYLRPDLVVDAGKCRRQKPSRLLDLRDEKKPIVLRS